MNFLLVEVGEKRELLLAMMAKRALKRAIREASEVLPLEMVAGLPQR